MSDFDPPSPSESNQPQTTPASIAQSVGAQPPTHIVGIGASAGGLEALERLFDATPDDTGMAFVVVQHLSPDFKSVMDEVLARRTRMPIRTVEDQMPVEANTVFLMPSKTEMIISDGKLLLTARARSEELRLPIDQFLRSLARDAGPQAIAVILSGTGSDGSRGIRDVHEAGGLVLAQSLETAKFDGMPRSAVETEVVDEVLAPEEIPDALFRRTHHPRSEQIRQDEHGGMTPIFRLLREAYGIDFSYYKPSTVARRTEHRMQLTRVPDLEEYVSIVRDNRDELDSLYRDLLIGVTSFFRDDEAFQIVETDVLPALLANVNSGDEFRIWVAGCATGEEAYSLAILLHEQIRQSGKTLHAKVFATDVHARSLERAAAGCYTDDEVVAVSEKRLREYFLRTKDGYRVSPELRNMVVFAKHNIIKDAPFTRMDLISCRNMLIYLLPNAQNKALNLFHFGLKTGGVLFLGPSESPGDLTNEFQALHPHWKLYRKRRDARLPPDLRLPMSMGASARLLGSNTPTRDTGLSDVFAQVLEMTQPPSVLLNSDLEILHTFGDAARYLKLRKGQPSLSMMEMLEDELRMAVGAALHRAARDKKPVTLNNVQTQRQAESSLVNVTVIPLPATRRIGAHTLVRFEEAVLPKPTETSVADLNLTEAARDHIESLESELRFTKENLQATVEELETSNEELQATNEELLASNEELQSTNEELHSVNEELYTVNAEYQKKIEELTNLTHDMENLLSSTDVHTIFLDGQLCIRRFTHKMGEFFNLIGSDIGRSIHGFMHSIRCVGLSEKLAGVLSNGCQYEEEVQNVKGESFLMRILPYKGDPEQAGVVITLVDITRLKEAETRFKSAMDVSPNGMLMVCSQGKITQVNSELERIFGYAPNELVGQQLEVLIVSDFSERHQSLRQDYFRNPFVIRRMGNMPYVWGQHKDGRRIPLDIHVRPISTAHGRQAIASVVDVSQHQQLEQSLRDQVYQRDRFLATLSHELRNPMGAILASASILEGVASQSAEIMRPCQVIQRQASKMALLLDDLLDVARVTQGKIMLRMEVVDLQSICRESIEAVHALLCMHRHQLVTQFPEATVWVRADRVRLLQVLENLLTNAIKYTDDAGRIELKLGSENGQAVIKITDNGRGMSKEFITTIFDMFIQSDDTLDRSEGGMGVGLTLVRSLVEMHLGTISATSDGPGKGSEFVVRLPLTEERKPRIQTAASDSATFRGNSKRLVLVEDDDDAREMMTLLLKQHKHDVVATADNGADGLELIRQHHPEVAVIDIGLPKLDGYQVARKVRSALGKSIYLIALTGYGQAEDHVKVLEAGFDQHLIKPVQIKQLSELLNQIDVP
jgi:two-component system CheB/CheR fusion protein